MSSYSHLLDNYLNTNTKSNNSLQLPPHTSMSSRLLRQEETTKYRDSPSQLAAQYTPLPRASAYNPRANESNTSGGFFDPRHTYSNKPSEYSENLARPTYGRDSSTKQAGGRMNLQQLQERRNIANTISPTHSGRVNDIDSIRKKHDDRTNVALNDLLNFKPFETYNTTRKNAERKDHSYNNILKDIDDCVSNMKKYSTRGTVNQSRNSPLNYEQSSRRDMTDRSPKYVNESSRDYANLQDYSASQIRPQASFEYQNNNLSAFLPKPTTTPKNGKSRETATPIERRTQVVERVQEAQENTSIDSVSPPESDTERKPPKAQISSKKHKHQKADEYREIRRESGEGERERQGHSRNNSRREIEIKKENSVPREDKEKNSIVELLKGQLNKENLSGESGDLAEILAKTVMKVMQNMPKQESQKEKEANLVVNTGVNTEQEILKNESKAAKGRMIIEKLEPLSYVPPEKPVIRTQTRTCETQTEVQENIQSFRNGYTPTRDYAPYRETHETHHDNYFGREQQSDNYDNRSRTNLTPNQMRSQYKYEQENPHFREERNQYQNDYFQPSGYAEDREHARQTAIPTHPTQSDYDQRHTEKVLDMSISQSRIEPINISAIQDKPPIGKKAMTLGTGTKTPQEPNFGYGKNEENRVSFKLDTSNPTMTPQRNPANQERNTWFQGSEKGKESISNSFSQEYEQKPYQKEQVRPSNNLSASKGRSSLKNLGNPIGQKSPAGGAFSPGLKNDKSAENAFFEKVSSMQETFSTFLKQKIQEVQAINHQYSANRETIKSPALKETSALKGQVEQSPTRNTSATEESTTGLFKSASAATGIQAYPGNKTLTKQSSREDRAAELPMVRVERRVPSSTSKKKGEWVQLRFQEEKEVDKIIMSYI